MIPRLPATAALLALLGLPAAAQQPVWDTYNGDLAATKFSNVKSFTPDNVATLEKAWQFNTGDVSDGSGDLPETVWSATPIYANGTLIAKGEIVSVDGRYGIQVAEVVAPARGLEGFERRA